MAAGWLCSTGGSTKELPFSSCLQGTCGDKPTGLARFGEHQVGTATLCPTPGTAALVVLLPVLERAGSTGVDWFAVGMESCGCSPGEGRVQGQFRALFRASRAPRDLERDFRQGPGGAGRGEWVQKERGEI